MKKVVNGRLNAKFYDLDGNYMRKCVVDESNSRWCEEEDLFPFNIMGKINLSNGAKHIKEIEFTIGKELFEHIGDSYDNSIKYKIVFSVDKYVLEVCAYLNEDRTLSNVIIDVWDDMGEFEDCDEPIMSLSKEDIIDFNYFG